MVGVDDSSSYKRLKDYLIREQTFNARRLLYCVVVSHFLYIFFCVVVCSVCLRLSVFLAFLKVASFIGLLPVLADCNISFLAYLCSCTIGEESD